MTLNVLGINFKQIWLRYTPLKQAAGQKSGDKALCVDSDKNRWFYDPKTDSWTRLGDTEDICTQYNASATDSNLTGWLKLPHDKVYRHKINTTDHEQETYTPCVVHSGTQTHRSCITACVRGPPVMCVFTLGWSRRISSFLSGCGISWS